MSERKEGDQRDDRDLVSKSHGKPTTLWCLHRWRTEGVQHEHVCNKDSRTDHHHKCRCEAIKETR